MKKSAGVILLMAVVLAVNVFVYFFLRAGAARLYKVISDVLAIISSLMAVGGLFIAVTGFKKYDFVKCSWLMLLLGMFLYFCAETLYGFYEVVLNLNMDSIFPSFADWLWVLGYMPLIAGLAMLLYGYKKGGLPMGNKKNYAVLGLLLTILFWGVCHYLFIPILNDGETSFWGKFVYMFYPTGDFVLIAIAVALAYITGLLKSGMVSRPWRCIAFGFILITLSDIIYSYLLWQKQYDSGSLVDIGWNAGYLLIALAGVYQQELCRSITGVENGR